MFNPYTIGAEEVHVWSIPLHAFDEHMVTVLDASERKRANQFYFAEHRRHFIVAHAAMRSILGNYFNLPPETFKYAYNLHGKPYLPDTAFNFNLAHSKHLAAFAIGKGRQLGVDIEYIQDSKMDVAKRFFSEEEYSYLESLPLTAQRDAFYRFWTKKEALAKAVGTGLNFKLNQFVVEDKPYQAIKIHKDSYHLFDLAIEPDFQAAIASNQPIPQIYFWQYQEAYNKR